MLPFLKNKEILKQLLRFIVVGFFNTGIDFGVLNFLMFITQHYSGWQYSLFKSISFTCAVINSYIWNKKWTFGKKDGVKAKEFGQFLLVSITAFTVNVGTATYLTNYIGPQWGINAVLWANISAVTAVILTTLINFLGYKYWVFKK